LHPATKGNQTKISGPGYAKSNHRSNLPTRGCPVLALVVVVGQLPPTSNRAGHWTSDTSGEKKARKIRTMLTARPLPQSSGYWDLLLLLLDAGTFELQQHEVSCRFFLLA